MIRLEQLRFGYAGGGHALRVDALAGEAAGGTGEGRQGHGLRQVLRHEASGLARVAPADRIGPQA